MNQFGRKPSRGSAKNSSLSKIPPEMIMSVKVECRGKVGSIQECAACNKKIHDRYLLKALDLYWHEECLKCGCCDCRLGEVGNSLYTKGNLLLCRRDYLRLFGSTGYCAACNKVIPAFEMVMRARTNVYHLECFACQQCGHRFCVGDHFYLHDNKILCGPDYEERMLFAQLSANPVQLAQLKSMSGGPGMRGGPPPPPGSHLYPGGGPGHMPGQNSLGGPCPPPPSSGSSSDMVASCPSPGMYNSLGGGKDGPPSHPSMMPPMYMSSFSGGGLGPHYGGPPTSSASAGPGFSGSPHKQQQHISRAADPQMPPEAHGYFNNNNNNNNNNVINSKSSQQHQYLANNSNGGGDAVKAVTPLPPISSVRSNSNSSQLIPT